jgi:hypothetical protein
MGFFKRQSVPASPQPARADEAVIVGDEDLAACASALGKMEEALLGGSDPGIRSSAREIAWAGGIRPQGDFMRWLLEIKMKDPDARPTDRPWWWLAAVADEAIKRGDPRLAGRIGFFLHGWHEWVAPKMTLADEPECGGIKIIPREAYAKGLGLALTALAPLPEEEMIVQTSEKFVPVSALRVTLAGAVLKLEQSGVAIDPEAHAAALQAAT